MTRGGKGSCMRKASLHLLREHTNSAGRACGQQKLSRQDLRQSWEEVSGPLLEQQKLDEQYTLLFYRVRADSESTA